MKLGYDGKRAVFNMTGLGNYSPVGQALWGLDTVCQASRRPDLQYCQPEYLLATIPPSPPDPFPQEEESSLGLTKCTFPVYYPATI